MKSLFPDAFYHKWNIKGGIKNYKLNFLGSYNLKKKFTKQFTLHLKLKKIFICAFKGSKLTNLALKKGDLKNKTLHIKKSLFISAPPHNKNNMTP